MNKKKSPTNGSLRDVWFALLGVVPVIREERPRLFQKATRRGHRLQTDLMEQVWELSKKVLLVGSKIGFEKKT